MKKVYFWLCRPCLRRYALTVFTHVRRRTCIINCGRSRSAA